MITQEELKRALHYNPDTGEFSRVFGKPVGTICHGYVRIQIGGSRYRAHALAWLYMTGEWPTLDVDHINRVRDDNRWVNLRLASRSQNISNRGALSTSKSGVKGVCWCDRIQGWIVSISGEHGSHRSNHYCLLNAVATAYRLQKIIHGEFTNHDT